MLITTTMTTAANIISFINNDPNVNKFVNWNEVSALPMPIDFVRKYADMINWSQFSQFSPVTPEIIKEFSEKVDCGGLVRNKNVTAETLEPYFDRMDWEKVQMHHVFSTSMFEKYKEKMFPLVVLECSGLPEAQIEWALDIAKSDAVVRKVVMYQTEMSEKMLEKCLSMMSNKQEADMILEEMAECQHLSEGFIETHYNNTDEDTLRTLIKHQTLGRKFLTSCQDTGVEKAIMRHQTLDQDLIDHFILDKDDGNIHLVATYQKCTVEQIEKWFPKQYPLNRDLVHIILAKRAATGQATWILPETLMLGQIDWQKGIVEARLADNEEDMLTIFHHYRKYINILALVTNVSIPMTIAKRLYSEKVIDPLSYAVICCKRFQPVESGWWTLFGFESGFWSQPNETGLAIIKLFVQAVKKSAWNDAFQHGQLSPEFIELFSSFSADIDKFWWNVSWWQTHLPEEFMIKHIDKLSIPSLAIKYKMGKKLREMVDPFLTEEDRVHLGE